MPLAPGVPKAKRPRQTRNPRVSLGPTYIGVSRNNKTGKYEAHLWEKGCPDKKGRQVYLGAYPDDEMAAHIYDLAALKLWGLTTVLNFPVSTYTNEWNEMQKMTTQDYLASLRRQSRWVAGRKSKYRGVTRHNGRWQARISGVYGKKNLYLGTFDTAEEAALAFDLAALKHRGPNTLTNFQRSIYAEPHHLPSAPPSAPIWTNLSSQQLLAQPQQPGHLAEASTPALHTNMERTIGPHMFLTSDHTAPYLRDRPASEANTSDSQKQVCSSGAFQICAELRSFVAEQPQQRPPQTAEQPKAIPEIDPLPQAPMVTDGSEYLGEYNEPFDLESFDFEIENSVRPFEWTELYGSSENGIQMSMPLGFDGSGSRTGENVGGEDEDCGFNFLNKLEKSVLANCCMGWQGGA